MTDFAGLLGALARAGVKFILVGGKQIKADELVDRAALDEGQFKADGGFARLDKIFEGHVVEVIGDLTDAIWEREAG